MHSEVTGEDNPSFSGTVQQRGNLREYQSSWPDGIVTYRMQNESDDFPENTFEFRALSLALLVWQIRIKGLKFKRLYREANADINVTFSKTDQLFVDQPSVLAYAWYPNGSPLGGDMVFNDNRIWSVDGRSIQHTNPDGSMSHLKTYKLVHTLIHEGGHALGLTHSESCKECVMHPYYNGNVRLAPLDVERIQGIYGKRWVPNWWINHVENNMMKRYKIIQ